MLRLMHLEELDALLLQAPALVQLQSSRNPIFPEAVEQWLHELERVLEQNRMVIVSNVAATRGEMLATRDGWIPASIQFSGRPTRRKIRRALASSSLEKVTQLITSAVAPDRGRIEEASQLAQLLVAGGKQVGLLPVPLGGLSRTEFLTGVWHRLSAHPDLKPVLSKLEGVVGTADALVLLDQALGRLRGITESPG